MDDQFRRNLQEVVQSKFDGSMTRASIGAGLNQDAVRRILTNPRHLPDVRTLKLMSDAYGWRFADAVYWLTGTDAPYELTPVQEAERGLKRMGVSDSVRASLVHVAQVATAAGVSR